MEQFEELKSLPITMDTDFANLIVKVQAAMDPFQHINVTSGTVGDAKLTRAELNKLADAIDEKRKEIKRAYLAPLDAFETKVKDLIQPIRLASSSIDTQVKDFETQEKESKRIDIQAYYQSKNCPADLNKIWKASWLNATVSEKQWKADVDAIVDKITTDLALLQLSGLDDQTLLSNLYLETLDAKIALQRYEQLTMPKVEPAKPIIAKPEPIFEPIEKAEEPLSVFNFQFFTTKTKMNDLLRWCDANKVSWEEKR